jgi:hypothetical protein
MRTANKIIQKYRPEFGMNTAAVLVTPLRNLKEVIEKNVMMVIALDVTVSGRRNPKAIVRHLLSSSLLLDDKI